jgi:hypothetical protein
MSKESHNWSDSEFWELNQGKEASFTWTHQFLFWFKHPIWTLSWNSLCMCVILSKTMSLEKVRSHGYHGEVRNWCRITELRFSSVPTRSGAWNSLWRACQQNLHFCYCDN